MADVSGIEQAGNIQQPNPLGIMKGWQDYANSLVQNRLMSQQTQNAALSNKVQTQQYNNTQTNDAAQKMYGVMSLPDNQVQSGAQTLLANLKSTGLIDPQHYQTYESVVQSGNVPAIRKTLTMGLIGTLSGPEAVHAVIGTPSGVNQGSQYQPGMVAGPLSPQSGSFAPKGPPVPLYLSPAERSQQVPAIDNNPNSRTYGQQGTVPLEQKLREQGDTSALGPNAGPPRLPPVSQNGAPATPHGFVPTGLPPGEGDVIHASVVQYSNDRARAGTFAQRIYPLEQAATLLPLTNTGPGTEWVHDIKQFLETQASALGGDAYKIQNANYAELQKYLTQVVNSNPMAAGSDARLASALTGNPSVHISNLAAQNVVKAAIGLERMQQAAVLSFQNPSDMFPKQAAKYGNGAPGRYGDYSRDFSSAVDPRAFIMDLLPQKQRDAVMDSIKGDSPMKKEQQAEFWRSYALAKKYGLLKNSAMPPASEGNQ